MTSALPILDLNAYHAAHGADLAEFVHMAMAGRGIPPEQQKALVDKSRADLVANVREVCKKNHASPRAITILCAETAKGFDRRWAELQGATSEGRA